MDNGHPYRTRKIETPEDIREPQDVPEALDQWRSVLAAVDAGALKKMNPEALQLRLRLVRAGSDDLRLTVARWEVGIPIFVGTLLAVLGGSFSSGRWVVAAVGAALSSLFYRLFRLAVMAKEHAMVIAHMDEFVRRATAEVDARQPNPVGVRVITDLDRDAAVDHEATLHGDITPGSVERKRGGS